MLKISNIDLYLDMIIPQLTDLVLADKPEWTVAQAIERCRSGAWLLLTADDDQGFGLCSIRASEYTNENHLVIEAVCMPPGSKGTDHYQQVWDFLARNLGCSKIVMQSKRRGWERKGWTPGWISYSRDVQEVLHDVDV